jgi:Pyruvate/2-oxoacid:ferredoxin oxidoreductase gamma subunit
MAKITQVCLSGFGGQGIILAGLLLKEINLKALQLGMEMARRRNG